jgi:hypothetical protein
MMPAATTTTTRMSARCPLCGESVLDVTSGGRVRVADVQPIPLYKHGFSGEGYLVCDSCAFLAHLPSDVTLN